MSGQQIASIVASRDQELQCDDCGVELEVIALDPLELLILDDVLEDDEDWEDEY